VATAPCRFVRDEKDNCETQRNAKELRTQRARRKVRLADKKKGVGLEGYIPPIAKCRDGWGTRLKIRHGFEIYFWVG
jgi:hypothetical protein